MEQSSKRKSRKGSKVQEEVSQRGGQRMEQRKSYLGQSQKRPSEGQTGRASVHTSRWKSVINYFSAGSSWTCQMWNLWCHFWNFYFSVCVELRQGENLHICSPSLPWEANCVWSLWYHVFMTGWHLFSGRSSVHPELVLCSISVLLHSLITHVNVSHRCKFS